MDEMMRVDSNNAGAVAVVTREESEIKAAILVAHSMPRDEEKSRARLMKSCERESFADSATYEFQRGGSNISGPSVDLAREAARCWGNIQYGLRIVSKDTEWIHVIGWAIDLESNARVSNEDKFRRRIQRKKNGQTVWVTVDDEREERELTNRRGAICVRNSILQLIPPDAIEDAIRKCDETLLAASRKSMDEKQRGETVKKLVSSFGVLGVTQQMLEKRIGRPLAEMSPENYAEMKRVYVGLRAGHLNREEAFPDDQAATIVVPPDSGPRSVDDIVAKEKGRKS